MDMEEKEKYIDKILESIKGKQGEPEVYHSAIELDNYGGCEGGYDFLYDFAMAVLEERKGE